MKKSSSSNPSRVSRKKLKKEISRNSKRSSAKNPSAKSGLPKPSKKLMKGSAYPRFAEEAFATQKMLYSVRDELIAHTERKFHDAEVKFHEVKAEIHGVKAELHEVKAELHEVKAEIHEVKSDLAKLDKSLHKIGLLVEEQNNRNKIVLDGLTQLFERQDRVEKKLDSSL